MKAKNRNCIYEEINIRSNTDKACVKYRSLVPVPYQKTETFVMINSILLLVVVVLVVVVVATIETVTEKKACHL
jgi:hypothetical protein